MITPEDIEKYKNTNNYVRLGKYYDSIKDTDNMIKYLLLGAENNSLACILNLGVYYERIGDTDNMFKYYLLGVEKKDEVCIVKLSCYYFKIKDYDNMEKYLLIALESYDPISWLYTMNYFKSRKVLDSLIVYCKSVIEKGNIFMTFFLGLIYQFRKEYDDMKKYYLMAIEKNDTKSMTALGYYYFCIKEYDNTQKYYSMIIDTGCYKALRLLINFYRSIRTIGADNIEKYEDIIFEKGDKYTLNAFANYYKMIDDKDNWIKVALFNYEKFDDTWNLYVLGNISKNNRDYVNMGKYYLMAIEKKDVESMSSLAHHYYLTKNYDLMKKYYLMAIENGYTRAYFSLGAYYEKIKDYDEMEKHYLMGIDHGHEFAMHSLGKYYIKTNMIPLGIKYLEMAVNKGHSLSAFELGLYYYSIKDSVELKKYSDILKRRYMKITSRCKTSSLLNGISLLSKYYELTGEPDDTLKCLLECLKLNPFRNMSPLIKYHKNYDPNITVLPKKRLYHKNVKPLGMNYDTDSLMKITDKRKVQLFSTYQLGNWYKNHNDYDNMMLNYMEAFRKGVEEVVCDIDEYFNHDVDKMMELLEKSREDGKEKFVKCLETFLQAKYDILFMTI